MLASTPPIHALRRMISRAKIAMFVSTSASARIPIVAAALAAVCCGEVRAADATWNVTNGGAWTNPTYWTPNTGSAPGSTNSTTSTDVATFGNATTAVRTINADTNRNIFGIVYSNNSYGYNVGGGGGSILLTDGGYIRAVGSGPAVTNTNSSGTQIIIQGSAGTASFLNDSASATMVFLGDVAGAATTGNTTTLHLGGSNNAVTNVFNVLLTDGTNGGNTALVVDGGIWNFARNSSAVTNAYGTNFTGGLTVNAGYVTTAAQRNYGTGLTTLGATSGSSNATLNVSFGLTNALLVRAGSSNNTLKLEITNTTGTATVSSPLTLQRDVEVSIANTAAIGNFTGAFDGTGTLTKTGSGTMTLNMTANRGNTIAYAINGGTLNYANPAATAEKNRMEVGSSGLLNINTTGMVIAGLDGSGVVDFVPSSGARVLRIGGTGSYAFSGTVSNTGVGTIALLTDLKEGGVQVLSGNSGGYKGTTTARSGNMALDYTSNTNSKLNSTTALYLWYGNIDLRGGATTITQAVSATTLQYGQSAITRSSGNTVLSLGGITLQTGGHLNIGADNIATTTSTNVNGVLGSARITVGGANFAKNDGAGNIVGLSAGDYTTTIPTGTTSTSTVYSLTDGLSRNNNLGVYGLKISTTQSGQVLSLGAANFTQGNILFTGSNDYTIQSTGSFGSAGSPYVLNYGAGKLTLDIGLGGQTPYFMGTGVTKLNKNASGSPTTIYLGGGTLEFSSNAQLGLESGGTTLTIAGGKLLADTTAGNILLTTNSGGGYRNLTLGGGDATIDVTGGNTLTVGGIIGNIETGGANPLTLGSATTSGKIVLGGVNTFIGDVKLAGGTTSISSDSNLGNTNNWVEFTGNATLETAATFGTARYVNLRSGVTGTFAPASGTTLTITNYVQGAGGLKVNGAGTLVLAATNNTYTGDTAIHAGTLQLGGSIAGSTLNYNNQGGAISLGSLTAVTMGGIKGAQSLALTNASGVAVALTVGGNHQNTAYSGAFSGAGTLTKVGNGTLTLSGANTHSGATTVSAGVLELAGTSGGAAGSTASVSVASGAKLLVSQSNQVNNSASVSLSGGTITRASGVSEVFGNLNLTQASFLDFGSGTAGNLSFGTYTPSSLLTVQNFFGGNTLVFKSDLTGSISDTSKFSFDSEFISSWDSGTSTFTITAIPEASTYFAAAGLAGLLFWPSRRRILKETSKILGLRRSKRIG